MSRISSIFTAVALSALFAWPPTPAPAQVADLSEIVEVRLLDGWRRADGRHMTAVEIRMAPGWKTYWRRPGVGGIPPVMELSVEEYQMHWPRPDVFYVGGMRSIGYADYVLLPVEFSIADGVQTVSGQIEIGVCLDICVPVVLPLAATLPDTAQPDPRIIGALSDRPLSGADIGAGTPICSIRPISDGLRVEVRIPMPDVGGGEEVVFELPDPSIWISDPSTTRDGSTLVASADIVPADASPFALDRSDLRITVLGARDAVELVGCHAG
ncbi:MAG: protein-disulfide reductase DsbD domain-containing protein [Pseudomonadota bacterium]